MKLSLDDKKIILGVIVGGISGGYIMFKQPELTALMFLIVSLEVISESHRNNIKKELMNE